MRSEREVLKWGVVVFVVWTMGIAVSCLYTAHHIKRFSIENAKETARALIEETILFRAWNAHNGGVYTPVSPTTPPNPYLEVPEREITTPSGKPLTKVNPAYMTRLVFEFQKKRLGVQGHITSLKPLNPQNAPDPWEKRAMLLFEKGVKEYSEKVTLRGKPALRLMLPLFTEKACLKCHAKQGYKEGDLRGGISVFVPLRPYLLLAKREMARSIMVSFFLWLAGVLLILLGTSKLYAKTKNLSRSEERFRVIFENAPEPIFMFDGEKITDCNQAMLDMLGANEKGSILKHPAELSPEHQPDGSPSFKRFNAQAGEVLLKGQARFKWLFKRFDGQEVWVDIIVSKIPRAGEKGHVMLAACRDITKETQLQEKVLQLRKLQALGELAGGIAHDFNNILAIVIGNITMARDFGVSHKANEMLKNAEQAVLRAANLTRKLITLSPGGTPLTQSISIEDLLSQSIKEVMKSEKKTNVKFSLDLSTDLWEVKGDPHQLFHTFTAILSNACEAMPNGGVVKIKAENIAISSEEVEEKRTLRKGRYVKISVSDEGEGIPPAVKSKIFDPFFTTKEMGRGLGLSIAYSVVKRHGGDIEVESEPGKGSTFTIYLPADEETANACRGTKGKILVMEDDPYQRELFVALLTNLGYCVVAVENSKEAVEEFAKAKESNEPFHLVILDLLMPKDTPDGKETCRQILEIDPEAKVIITSVASSDDAVKNFRKYGFVGALPKPFTLQDLAQAVEKAMNGESPRFS